MDNVVTGSVSVSSQVPCTNYVIQDCVGPQIDIHRLLRLQVDGYGLHGIMFTLGLIAMNKNEISFFNERFVR